MSSAVALYEEASQRIDACRGQDCDQCDASDPGSVNGCGADPHIERCVVASPLTVLCDTTAPNRKGKFFRAEDIKACFDKLLVHSNTAEKTKRTMLNYLSMYS